MLYLLDRRGGLHELDTQDNDTLAQALLRKGIPPTSVLAFRNDDNTVIADDTRLHADTTYTARLIEGYDIEGLRALYDRELSPGGAVPPDLGAFTFLHRRLGFAPTGALTMERGSLDGDDVVKHVEETVYDTIDHFGLAPPGSSVTIGLSGGVDSGSLLMLLAKYRDEQPASAPRIVAGTFKDFDSKYSDTFDSAARLAARFGVEHHVIPAESAESVFHLTRPIAQILMLLMETDDAHQAMYVDHHTTRRVLEVFADDHGSSRIALGLHATDLVAGLINSWTSAHEIGSVPERAVGDHNYVMPLSVVPKRELHVYYTMKTGNIPNQTVPNQWEFNPTDRNFYYYLADQLQWMWPGVQHWLFDALRAKGALPAKFNMCENCGGATRILAAAAEWSGLCDVCALLHRHGWIAETH